MAVKNFDVMSFNKALIDPEQLGYQDSIEIIKDESLKVQKSFVKIGWYLKHIRDNELYKENGYDSVWECAADQLGYSRSTASRFINICEKFSKDHNSPELDTKYSGFDKSQMIEMLPMEPEQLDKVTPDMTVKQIRNIKAESKVLKEVPEQVLDDSDIPGQTTIEKDFPEYLPEARTLELEKEEIESYATSHKENDPCLSSGLVDKDKIIDGEYQEIKESESIEEPTAPEKNLENNNKETVDPVLKDDLSVTKYILEQERGKLNEFLEFNDLPEMTVLRQKIIVAALAAMVCDLEDKDSESEPQSQPEFPILKNNDQRKEWLADYKAWGLWYRDEHIDVNYYKYDFPDGSRLVVTEYPERYACWIDKRRDEHYYHLMEKDKKSYKKTYDEQYRHLPDPETYLVEFLKNIQKKG